MCFQGLIAAFDVDLTKIKHRRAWPKPCHILKLNKIDNVLGKYLQKHAVLIDELSFG